MSTNLKAVNEPVRSYEPGSDDRKSLQIDFPKPPFWRPFGFQNRKKVVPGGYPKKHQ